MQIKVEHPTVEEVFTASFYEVPAFQREYVWKDAQLFMTKSLAESQSVGANTGFTKAAKLLSQHIHWDSSAIEKRQGDLKNLALELWTFAPRSTA